MRPWEVKLLTHSQLNALLGEASYMLYLRDRAFKGYHFSKLGKESWAALANPTAEPADPNLKPALAAFYAEYGLPEYQFRAPLTALARQDIAAALSAGRVPNWVLNMLKPEEIKAGEL